MNLALRGGALKLHRSYNFVDKHRIIDLIRTAIEHDGRPLYEIAEEAGVTPQTLHLWFNGKVRWPRADTLDKVAKALGKRFVLTMVDAPAPAPRNDRQWDWRKHVHN